MKKRIVCLMVLLRAEPTIAVAATGSPIFLFILGITSNIMHIHIIVLVFAKKVIPLNISVRCSVRIE